MALHPQAQTLLDQMAAASDRQVAQLEVPEARAMFKAGRGLGRVPDTPVAAEDRMVPGPGGAIALRIYRPASPPSQRRSDLPIMVYFHGGGFVFGDLDTHDPLCRQFAAAVPAVVVSVDYRLAPEHRFPAAVDDAEAAVRWVAEQARSLGADGGRLVVAGDSAGGTLAAVAARRARDAGGPPISLQLLIYPVTDLSRSYPSHQTYGHGYFLTTEAMAWFTAHYLGADALDDTVRCRQPDASPLFTGDLSGLPRAHVVTAEFDPLRDEGEAYAQRLGQAGVATTQVRYDGMIHGFVSMDGVLDSGAQAIADMVAVVADVTGT